MTDIKTNTSGYTKIQNTKRELLNALIELSMHQNIDEISVSSLCRQADVNRTTFYKYYTIPSDILLEKLTEVVKESASFAASPDLSVYDNMLRLTHAFYENRQIMTLYFSASGNIMPFIYKSITMAIGNPEFMKKPANNFLAGGVCGLAMYWMQQGFVDSPEVIAAMLSDFIEKLQR